jgi:hypothetical protein
LKELPPWFDVPTLALAATALLFLILPTLVGLFRRKVALRSGPWVNRGKLRGTYLLGVSAASVVLIVLNGLPKEYVNFKVDTSTILLLVIASLPVLQEYLTTIKAGSWELSFRELSVHDQVFVFLDGIARQQVWTFYKPREGEKEFGEAFLELAKGLVKNEKGKLTQKLFHWLKSDNDCLIYFASEVAGYFNYEFRELKEELKKELRRHFDSLPNTDPWSNGELNCLWAYSRYEEPQYAELKERFLQFSSSENKRWVLHAIMQMVNAASNDAVKFRSTAVKFKPTLDRYLDNEESEELKAEAIKLLEQFPGGA